MKRLSSFALSLFLLMSVSLFAQQGGGVQSINGVPGPFTFGSGSTCVGTTCTFSGGGGGATFPSTNGIVFNTSTTASRNATASDIETTLGSVYLPLTGGTLTGPLTIASTCSSGNCTLFTSANNAGNWSGFNVLSSNNTTIFQASNQFSGGYKPFVGVSASLQVASGLGPPTYVYGMGMSCASGNPNYACLGGMFQAPSSGVLDLSQDNNNTVALTFNVLGTENVSAAINSALYQTKTHCASAASPAVCAAAPAGFVNVATSATTVVVDTTAVTANSQILLQEDSSLGTALSVTCNTTPATGPPTISARTPGTSFTITTTAPTTNPRCFSYSIVN